MDVMIEKGLLVLFVVLGCSCISCSSCAFVVVAAVVIVVVVGLL